MHKKECAAMQRWAAGAPSLDVAIPAEPIRCLGRVLWGKQKRGLDSTWTHEIDAMQSRTLSSWLCRALRCVTLMLVDR
jgi:SET and MYND domain-containing protein